MAQHTLNNRHLGTDTHTGSNYQAGMMMQLLITYFILICSSCYARQEMNCLETAETVSFHWVYHVTASSYQPKLPQPWNQSTHVNST